MYDLAILGGGPAGVAAGVYASRKRLKTIFITKEFGGQSLPSEDIQNWIGTISIRGADLAKNLEAHLLAYADDILTVEEGHHVEKIERSGKYFKIKTAKESFAAKAVLIATGSHRRKLAVPGADKFENKGLTYCASCDGPLFSGMDVAVVGGGNAGFETAAELLAYTKSVTLLETREKFSADPVTVKKVLAHKNIRALTGIEILQVNGDKFVSGIVYSEKSGAKSEELPVQGIFVEIGSIPTTDFVKDIVALNPLGHIVTDPRNQRTSVAGIWAAGDCTDGLYHQNNIAAGDAVKALEDIYLWLHTK
jgi:alkyl hydroperoxide reductase subunit F